MLDVIYKALTYFLVLILFVNWTLQCCLIMQKGILLSLEIFNYEVT